MHAESETTTDISSNFNGGFLIANLSIFGNSRFGLIKRKPAFVVGAVYRCATRVYEFSPIFLPPQLRFWVTDLPMWWYSVIVKSFNSDKIPKIFS